MKLVYLEHIIETLLADVPCPHCDTPLNEDVLEVKNITDNQADIYVPCKNCGSQISICADIQENIPETMFRILLPNQKQKKNIKQPPQVSEKNIQDISHSLQNFQDRDIRKLFLS